MAPVLQEPPRPGETKLRAWLENSAEAVGLLDANGLILDVGPSVRLVLGYERDQLVGRHALELVHSDDVARCREALPGRRASPGRAVVVRCRVRHGGGSWRLMESAVANRLGDPAVGAIVINARDVTERMRLEEQFGHARRMEALSRLAGGVAHDINNLLTVILAHAGFLLERLPPGDPIRRHAEELVKAGEQAGLLAGRLLDSSRREAARPQIVDLNVMVSESGASLRRLLGDDIELSTPLAPGSAWVLAEAGQIEQVVVNLCMNARDAMPGGGRLTLATAHVALDEARARRLRLPAGFYVLLSVNDTGCGMDAEVRAHLGEPFFTTKEPGRGTGLGLWTVYGVVRQCGGEIRATSRPGRGSTFEIYLPLAGREIPGHGTELAGPGPPADSGAVLRVEDDGRVSEAREAPG